MLTLGLAPMAQGCLGLTAQAAGALSFWSAGATRPSVSISPSFSQGTQEKGRAVDQGLLRH